MLRKRRQVFGVAFLLVLFCSPVWAALSLKAHTSHSSTHSPTLGQWIKNVTVGTTWTDDLVGRVSLSALVSLYRAHSSFLFAQGHLHVGSGDVTGHAGLVYRVLTAGESFIMGGNVIMDATSSVGGPRISLGVEGKSLFYDLLGNLYLPTKRSAWGADLKTVARIPVYPQLSLFLKGFKWKEGILGSSYGYQVGAEDRLSDALGVRLDYTRWLSSSQRRLQISVVFRYVFGHSLADQIHLSFQPRTLSLSESMFDLVDRDNDIKPYYSP